MATRPFSIDQPPAQPPEVQNQMQSGLASMLQNKLAASQGNTPGAPQPSGAPTGGGLPPEQKMMLVEAVSRGLQQLQRDPQMAPYAERCLAILDAAKQAAGSGGPAAPPPGAGGPPGIAPPETPKTPEGGAGFPG